jgi:hypothetical protein
MFLRPTMLPGNILWQNLGQEEPATAGPNSHFFRELELGSQRTP